MLQQSFGGVISRRKNNFKIHLFNLLWRFSIILQNICPKFCEASRLSTPINMQVHVVPSLFDCLKSKLVESPVLVYLEGLYSRNRCYSGQGLGAILSQTHSDGKRHPVHCASRALSAPAALASERQYAVTELKMLAVVWAISHFHHHL